MSYFDSLHKQKEIEPAEEADADEEYKPKTFESIKQYIDETTGNADDLLYFLLNGVLEQKVETLQQHLPNVIQDFISVKQWEFEGGLSRFIQELSDACSDSPHAPEWLFNLVMKPMIEKNRVNLKNIDWIQPEEDIFAVGGHIQLIALLIKFKAQQNENPQEAINQVDKIMGK